MKALTKQGLRECSELSQRLQLTYARLETEVELFNEALAQHWGRVDDACIAYQRVVDDVRNWCEDVATQIQEEIDSHQEKWQDSERGQAFVQWQQEYEQADLEDINLEQPEPLSLDINDQSEVLEGLPEGPG